MLRQLGTRFLRVTALTDQPQPALDEPRVIQAAQATGNEADASPSVFGRQTDKRMRAVHVSLTDHGARRAKSFARVASSSLEVAST